MRVTAFAGTKPPEEVNWFWFEPKFLVWYQRHAKLPFGYCQVTGETPVPNMAVSRAAEPLRSEREEAKLFLRSASKATAMAGNSKEINFSWCGVTAVCCYRPKQMRHLKASAQSGAMSLLKTNTDRDRETARDKCRQIHAEAKTLRQTETHRDTHDQINREQRKQLKQTTTKKQQLRNNDFT